MYIYAIPLLVAYTLLPAFSYCVIFVISVHFQQDSSLSCVAISHCKPTPLDLE